MTTIVAAVLSALVSGGLVGIVQTRAQNRRTIAEAVKANAEAEVTLGGGWRILWETAHKDLSEMRERLAVVEANESRCQERLAALERETGGDVVGTKAAALVDAAIATREGTDK